MSPGQAHLHLVIPSGEAVYREVAAFVQARLDDPLRRFNQHPSFVRLEAVVKNLPEQAIAASRRAQPNLEIDLDACARYRRRGKPVLIARTSVATACTLLS